MNGIQKNLFNLLIEFDEICKKYDIQYLLAAGASLGAVRNHCFMPWDDDIDLYITRDNWNKLRHLVETQDNILPKERSLIYKENTPYYCNSLPRYVDETTTTLYRSQALAGKACGQHIELFIFDPMPVGDEQKKEYIKLLKVYTELLSHYFIVNKNASLEDWKEHYELYEKYYNRIDKEGEDKVIKELEEELQQYSPKECDQYCMCWGTKNYIYNKEHFEQGELGNFEGKLFPIGNKPEGILRVAYGDNWMYVPEFEEQVVHGGVKFSDLSFHEFTDRYIEKINREKVFEEYKKNKRNLASIFYQKEKFNMLSTKAKLTTKLLHQSNLKGKEDYFYSLLQNKDYLNLIKEFEEYMALQLNSNVKKYNLIVPISDKNLITLLQCLIDVGKYYDANEFFNIYKTQNIELSSDFKSIENEIIFCRQLSIARYDKKDEILVQSLIEDCDDQYNDLLDVHRAKLWIKEQEAESIDDFKVIDEYCDEILKVYPFDGETMAFQARAKMECGQEQEAMNLYRKSIDNTRNGLIWQKVEDESGISRIEIERDLIEEINNEN